MNDLNPGGRLTAEERKLGGMPATRDIWYRYHPFLGDSDHDKRNARRLTPAERQAAKLVKRAERLDNNAFIHRMDAEKVARISGTRTLFYSRLEREKTPSVPMFEADDYETCAECQSSVTSTYIYKGGRICRACLATHVKPEDWS